MLDRQERMSWFPSVDAGHSYGHTIAASAGQLPARIAKIGASFLRN